MQQGCSVPAAAPWGRGLWRLAKVLAALRSFLACCINNKIAYCPLVVHGIMTDQRFERVAVCANLAMPAPRDSLAWEDYDFERVQKDGLEAAGSPAHVQPASAHVCGRCLRKLAAYRTETSSSPG